ncbi:hypothetical protein [Paenibacillus sp. S150]|uniref:hypothetical protein n=1 Tax=Paenibacillus sp. S150 TaxID=2749826 RepID=UPI001C563C03|nr:hypothetical protein [Paenibacillus sp. S150]MBW4081211.1 hypothetical protein [Paenibacillus sp. S150]
MKRAKGKTAAAAGVLLCVAAVLLLCGGYGPERLLGLGGTGTEAASAKAQGTQEGMPADAEAARINGRAVTAAEMKYAMGLQRTRMIEYFRDTYNQAYDEGFWELELGGENPLELVKREALTAWTRSRIVLEMGQEAGLTESTEFSSLLAAMERENKRRAQAAASGKPVFGPAELDAGSFIPYYLSNLEIALQEKRTAVAAQAPDQPPEPVEPASAAPGEREPVFTRISVAYRSEGAGAAETKADTRQLLSEVRQLLLDGRSPEEAVLELGNDSASFGGLTLSRERLDSANARVYFREQGKLYAWLTGERESGEISPVMDEGFIGEWVVAALGDAEPLKAGTAAEQRKGEAPGKTGFEQELEQRVRTARIELTEPGYSGLQLQ